MTHLTEQDRVRLIDFFDGRLAPAERAECAAWIAQTPERAVAVERLRLAWGVSGAVEREHWDSAAMWSAVMQGRRGTSPAASLTAIRGVAKPSRVSRTLWSAATALVLCVGIPAAFWQYRAHHQGWQGTRAPLIYTTGNGQRANITLPDGSTASLNVASRLEVAPDFATGNRAVRLTGEALFTVAHEAGSPFTVVAGTTTARVLGTSLVVRHYATDTTTLVAVRDGRVAVHSLVLTASQQVEVLGDGKMIRRTADPSQFTFATGTLTLDGLALPAAVAELNRWYDVDIRIGDPSLNMLGVGGKFAAGSITDLAAILEGTLDVRAVREGRRLTLYPRD